MKPVKFLLSMAGAILISTISFSQADLNGPVPVDPEIRMGKLENGLTYFIRHNKEPENRASFYIIQNVGAILENDDQNGLAHFLEHMAFNGTGNFPGKAIISGLEKNGVAFGHNINAYTWYDETVYNLSDVPIDKRPDLVDTCLLILHDWSDNISLLDKEIDLERGVITEEWRTYKNASARMLFDKVIPVVLKGSKYPQRDVIGSLDVIKNFSYKTIRDFYHDWYRTDLQAIAVVGDINVDKEAPQTSVSVVTLHKDVPKDKRDLKYLRDSYMTSLMNSMINTRISELLQKGNPPFVAGSGSFGSYYTRGYDAFSITAIARKNEEAIALESVYAEAERTKKFGFTKGELDREKARMLATLENTVKQKDKISNYTYAGWIQNYFLTGEPLTSADFDFENFKQVMDGITHEEISAKFRQVMIDENRTIIIQGLEGDDVKHLTEQEALDIISKVKNSQLTAYADEALAESLIKEELAGSKITKTMPLPQFDAVEWTLENNAKVVYRKAEYEKDNILLTAFSFGGFSKLDDDQVLAAYMLPNIAPMYGAGDYDNISLQKMLSGKKASATLTLAETTEGISGSSTPKDFETMMQSMYLRGAEPRFDKEAHDAIIDRYG